MPNDNEFELDDLESFSFDDLSLDEAPVAAEGSADEDPFGVWVKSAPEDIGAGGSPDDPLSELDVPAAGEDPLLSEDDALLSEDDALLSEDDALLSEDDALLSEDDALSSEELANLDDSFDFVTVSEVPLEGEVPLEDEMAFLDTPEALEAERAVSDTEAVPAFDEVSLDDFVSFDDSPAEPPVGDTLVSDRAPDAEDDGLNEDFLDIDIDIDDDINDEELEIIEGALPRSNDSLEEVSVDSFTAQDVDLSEFGDFEEVAPVVPVGLDAGEDLPEVVEVPEIAEAELTGDDELVAEFAQSELLADPLVADTEGFFEEAVLEEAMPPLEDQGPVTLDLEPDDHTDMDHIMALEEDLTSGIRPTEAPTAPAAPASGAPSDLAALILGKIEQELSSIKQEISELKNEVTHLRSGPAFPAAEAPVVSETPDPLVEAEAKPHGFFDEEDDETIALTGDELDNILSTAEISEGEEAGVSLDEDLLSLDGEGNLIDPVSAALPEDEAVHVTDEEFFAGTALDMNEDEAPVALTDDAVEDLVLGVPESIELEEGLPEGLEESETEDLLAGSDAGTELDEFVDVAPLPEGLLEGTPEPLEIPFDDDIALELADLPPLAPELTEEPLASEAAFLDDDLKVAEELSLESLPDLDSGTEEALELPSDSEGWTPPSLDVEEQLVATHEPVAAPLPPPAPVPEISSASGLSPNLKDELRAVLSYMDKLLASLPDDKIQEFAESEHFEVYKRLFEELGLIE